MHKITLILLVFLSTVISSCSGEKASTVYQQLSLLDKAIWCDDENDIKLTPEAALDSLKMLDHLAVKMDERAYYDLLYTIFADKSYIYFENDSIISGALSWFAESKDYRNYSRALLYEGIINYRLSAEDTICFNYIRQAETVYDKYEVKDKYLLSFIYHYMWRLNSGRKNNEEAEYYLDKEYNLHKQINRYSDALANICSYSLIEIELYHRERGLQLMREAFAFDSVPKSLEWSMNILHVQYLLLHDEYEQSIIVNSNLRAPDLSSAITGQYFLAFAYNKLGQSKEAALHADTLVRYLDKLGNDKDINNQVYYNVIGRIYHDNEEYEKSCYAYRKSSEFYNLKLKLQHDNTILNLEKKFNLEKKEQEIKTLQMRNIIYLLLVVILLSVIGFILLVIRNRRKGDRNRIEYQNLVIKGNVIEKTITDASLGMFYEFQNEVYNQFITSLSSTDTNRFEKLVAFHKHEFNKKLANALSSDEIINNVAMMRHLDDLSPKEKSLILLIFLRSSTQRIAKVFNTSPSSVRGMKRKLRLKIESIPTIPAEEKEQLLDMI